MKPGDVAILNCTDGDTRISFDPRKRSEVERAKIIVADMLKRGFLLGVMVDGRMERVLAFDEAHCEYIVTDYQPPQESGPPAEGVLPPEDIARAQAPRPSRGRKRVSATSARVIAVGPTAGGGPGVYAHGVRRSMLERRARSMTKRKAVAG